MSVNFEMSFWCLQFHPINEQKQVYLRFWEYQKVLFKLTDLYQSTIFQISFNCKSTSGLKVDPLTLSLQLWREQRSEYSIYGEKNHHKSFSHMLLVCFGSIVSIYHLCLGKIPLSPLLIYWSLTSSITSHFWSFTIQTN